MADFGRPCLMRVENLKIELCAVSPEMGVGRCTAKERHIAYV